MVFVVTYRNRSSIEPIEEEEPQELKPFGNQNLSLDMTIKTSRVWDVKTCPSRKNPVGDQFAPMLSLGRKKTGRIKIEVMRPRTYSKGNKQDLQSPVNENDDICASVRNSLMLELLSGNKTRFVDFQCDLLPGEEAVMRVLEPEQRKKFIRKMITRHNSRGSTSSEDDFSQADGSISTMGLFGPLGEDDLDDALWIEKCCHRIVDIEIISRVKTIVEYRLANGSRKIRRLAFKSGNESRSFFELVTNLRNKIENRKVSREESDEGESNDV